MYSPQEKAYANIFGTTQVNIDVDQPEFEIKPFEPYQESEPESIDISVSSILEFDSKVPNVVQFTQAELAIFDKLD